MAWNKREGEQIRPEEILVVIETNDLIYELQGYTGIVRLIHAFVDESVLSGQVVGLVGSDQESLPDLDILDRLEPPPARGKISLQFECHLSQSTSSSSETPVYSSVNGCF